MSDYTPTDGEILTAVVLYRAISSVDAPPPMIDTIATPEEAERYLGEYQRWLAEHDAKVRAETLREFAGVVREVAALGPENTGLRKPAHLAEYAANYADRIERETGLK